MNYLSVFIRLFIFISLLGSLSLVVYAQTQPSSVDETETIENQAVEQPVVKPADIEEPPAEQAPAEEENESGNFDVFKPSEDISEDLAVPFPVDI